jgi:hypothetical protein
VLGSAAVCNFGIPSLFLVRAGNKAERGSEGESRKRESGCDDDESRTDRGKPNQLYLPFLESQNLRGRHSDI